MLTGNPIAASVESFKVQVTDKAGLMIDKTLTLTITDTAGGIVHPPVSTNSESLARAVLRTVRRSINEYRGKSWDGLIVARNRLMGAMILTALTAYVLLAIAVICNAPQHAIAAASVLYLVGATVGLYSRLRSQSNPETAVEDYGLSAARLVTIPVFSGLAAIGGVVLMAMAPYVNTVFGPTAPTSPPAIITASSLPEGTVDTAYNHPLQATGGTPPYSWKVTKGAMPDGLIALKTGLRASYDRLKALIHDAPGWPSEREIGGAIATIVHTAYHLGEIRQALCTMQAE